DTQEKIKSPQVRNPALIQKGEKASISREYGIIFFPYTASVRRGPAAERIPRLLSVDRGHLVQAVLLGFEPQVGDAVGHVHSLGRVGVGAGGWVGGHGAEEQDSKGYVS
ncbi:hypothetical protein XENOCAPTIV_001800, partial [Xenoophorus captivus]